MARARVNLTHRASLPEYIDDVDFSRFVIVFDIGRYRVASSSTQCMAQSGELYGELRAAG